MESKEKIKIEKELKIKMLQALKAGYFLKGDFEEFMPDQVTIFELPNNHRN